MGGTGKRRRPSPQTRIRTTATRKKSREAIESARWEVVQLDAGQEEEHPPRGVTEAEAWLHARNQQTPSADEPTERAVVAVLRRAFVADFDVQRHPDWWPDNDLDPPVDDLAPLIDADSVLKVAASLLTERHMTVQQVVTTAADVYDLTYGIHLLGRRILERGALIVALNEYPYADSIAARILAPLVRRLMPRAVGPAWYFRSLAAIQRSKRVRPHLVPHGWMPKNPLSAPHNYGWEGLECWLLKVYLFDDKYERSGDRLEQLVRFAGARLKDFASRARVVGPLAVEFDGLCGSLRRYLFWLATVPNEPRAFRIRCRELLRDLQKAVVPRMPPKEARVIRHDDLERYNEILRGVRDAWRATRGAQRKRTRREALESTFDLLGFLASAEANSRRGWFSKEDAGVFVKLRERFWRDCGDPYSIPPADFARRLAVLISAFYERTDSRPRPFRMANMVNAARRLDRSYHQLQIKPQAFKERLAQIERSPFYRVQRARVGTKEWEDPVFVP